MKLSHAAQKQCEHKERDHPKCGVKNGMRGRMLRRGHFSTPTGLALVPLSQFKAISLNQLMANKQVLTEENSLLRGHHLWISTVVKRTIREKRSPSFIAQIDLIGRGYARKAESQSLK
jgi:hypothetical protein